MATYTLPDIVIKGNTYSIVFYDAVSGLTVPARNPLISIGRRSERIDGNSKIGAVMPENISLEFIDVGGFFHSLLAQECKVKILRNSVDEFYGRIQRKEAEWGERYVSGTTAKRFVKFEAINVINTLRDYTAGDIVQSIITGDADHPVEIGGYLKLKHLFSVFMVDCFGTSLALAEPIIPNNDFQYFTGDDGSAERIFAHLYVNTGFEYFDDTNDRYLGNQFSTALDMLSAFAKSFGFIPRITYDAGNSAYRLTLHTRRKQTYSAPAITLPLMQSKKKKISSNPTAFIFRRPLNEDETSWHYNKGNTGYQGYNSEPPADVDFEIDTTLLWVVSSSTLNERIYYSPDGTSPALITHMTYYSYNGLTWISFRSNKSPNVHLNYYVSQWGSEKEEYERTYKGFSAFTIFDILEMHNGSTTKDYMIDGFERDYAEKTETYILIEV